MSKQFDDYQQNIDNIVEQRSLIPKKPDVEPQTKMSTSDIEKARQIYLKPNKTIGTKEKFNEEYRDEYNYAKEYVQFIAENKELIGENIEIWTKRYPGVPAEFWIVPTNKPVWGPRYLAEQIKSKYYRRLRSEQSTITGSDGVGTFYGQIVTDTVIQRLDAIPVNNTRKSIFMGAS
jgi:hypothetical protein